MNLVKVAIAFVSKREILSIHSPTEPNSTDQLYVKKVSHLWLTSRVFLAEAK